MDLTPYLKLMAEKNASDLFFCTGTEPRLKVEGNIRPVGSTKLLPGEVEKMAMVTMSDEQKHEFETTLECNFAISMHEVGRFRVNIFRQRSEVSIVIRYIQSNIPRLEDINLPDSLKHIIMEKRGLILVVGATGSGKSTSLAAMIGHRNRNSASHILTIEDPLEFIHHHEKSIVQQREVGIDTLSYENALKNALREAPDVILIGEIRDIETMKHAINYAETGHLCLATLHANNANQALDRILNFFPDLAHKQLLTDLSLNLKGIISQRLLRSVDGKLVPAVEVMLNTPYIAELISKGSIGEIKEAMKDSAEEDIVTFDQAIFTLYKKGLITLDEAIANADSKNDLSLAVRMDEGHSKESDNSVSELIMG
ncbi:MAG: type IV pili twitching motility protein PilT [Gammaproteobacteria bacterium]|nr:MAG: type IV pili twitching motility protein PilT [Gammaproteobacteria bacterium]